MIPSSSPTTCPPRSTRAFGGAASAVLAILLLATCAPPPAPEQPEAADRLPLRTPEDAAHYRVVEEGTLVYVRVYRGGRLASLGHNHVVVFNDVRGDVFLGEEPGGSLFDLLVSPAGADVDPPALRQRQSREFQTEISDNARARTRTNMLGGEILDARTYPYVRVSSTSISGSWRRPRVTLELRIREQTRRFTIPISLDVDGDRLVAEGRIELRQSEFGIEPFSTLGGALKVKDRVEVLFTVTARRAT